MHVLLFFKLPSFLQEPCVPSLLGGYAEITICTVPSDTLQPPLVGEKTSHWPVWEATSHSHDDLDPHLTSTLGFQKVLGAVPFEPDKRIESHCVQSTPQELMILTN